MKIPILKLKDILLTSIHEDLSDKDAFKFQEELLDSVMDTNAKGVVIDISTMDLVDSYLARVLNETATMAQFLGTKVVICGMRPAVALTLTEMGRELIDVKTALNLEQGFEIIQRLLKDDRYRVFSSENDSD